MQQSDTILGPSKTKRAVWLVLGGFFALLTARVLLWEVHGFVDLTADHLLTIGAVVGAIAAGIFFWQMLWECRLVTAAGLGIAFCAATTYCLVGSAGRGDEAAFERNATARQANDDRSRAQRNRGEAKTRYEAALAAETAECSGGAGAKCIAKRETTGLRRTDFEVAETLLKQQGPEQRENGKLKRAADLIAFFGGIEQEKAEKGLALIWPFIPPLVCELLTIVFLHLGFGVHGRTVRVARAPNKPGDRVELGEPGELNAQKDAPNQGGTAQPAEPVKPVPQAPPVRPGRPMTRLEAEQYLVTQLALGRELPSQDWLREQCGLSKATASDWLQHWKRRGLVETVRSGRCNLIVRGRKFEAA